MRKEEYVKYVLSAGDERPLRYIFETECLCRELTLRGIAYKRQVSLPILYKGAQLDGGYKLDILVEETVIPELKSVETLEPIHQPNSLPTCASSVFGLAY